MSKNKRSIGVIASGMIMASSINIGEGFVITRNGIQNDFKPNVTYSPQEIATIKNATKFDGLTNLTDPTTSKKLIEKYDSQESIFLRDQLTVTIQNVIDTWYPELSARKMFPFRSMGIVGMQSVRFIEKNWNGRARAAGSQKTGMPTIGLSKNPTYKPVINMEVGAKYSLYELQSAMLGKEPLASDYLEGCKKAQELAANDLAFGVGRFEDELEIPGLFNQPEMIIKNSDLVGTADEGSLADINLLTCTADEAYDGLCAIVDVPHNYTQNTNAVVDTVSAPIAQINRLKNLKFTGSTNIGKTVLGLFLENNPNIKQIIAAPELADNDLSDETVKHKDVMVAYKMSPDILEFVVTNNFTVLPTSSDGPTAFIIPTTQGLAGLFIYKKAIAMIENCGNA